MIEHLHMILLTVMLGGAVVLTVLSIIDYHRADRLSKDSKDE